MKKIFIIAGETSGDVLAADVIKQLKTSFPNIELSGIGGSQSLSAGLPQSLFPMNELSIMGIAEILPKIPAMLRRINQTVAEIERIQPDIVLTIDSPDFSFRVQKKLKAKNLSCKQVHYVAPTVWAWRSGRAKKIAKFLDGVLCLFPFEPSHFEKVGLKAVYTGHPVIARYNKACPRSEARQALGYTHDDEVIGVLLGSRRGELKAHANIFLSAVKKCMKENTKLLIPTLPHIRQDVESYVHDHFGDSEQIKIVSNPELQTTYFKSLDKALAVSGTVGLELAVAGVPHVVGYKAHPLTAAMIKRVVKVRFAHLANIILDTPIVPECIQERCRVDQLSGELNNINQKSQKKGFQTLSGVLDVHVTPAETIEKFLIGLAENK